MVDEEHVIDNVNITPYKFSSSKGKFTKSNKSGLVSQANDSEQTEVSKGQIAKYQKLQNDPRVQRTPAKVSANPEQRGGVIAAIPWFETPLKNMSSSVGLMIFPIYGN